MNLKTQIKKALFLLLLNIIRNLSMPSTWAGIWHGFIAAYGFITHDTNLIAIGGAGFGAGVAYGNGKKEGLNK
jgi:hypothetical protein